MTVVSSMRDSRNTLRRLLSHSAVYAAGDLLTKFAKYLLIPVYMSVMSPADIGTLAVIQAVTMISWATSTLGLGASLKRFYVDGTAGDSASLAPNLWVLRTTIAFPIVLLIAALAWIAGPTLAPDIPTKLLWISIATGYFKASTEIPESLFMMREEPMRYRGFTFLFFLSTALIILILVLGYNLGVYGVILGECIVAFVWFLLSAWIVRPWSGDWLPAEEWEKIARYSAPLVPHVLFMLLLVSGDRLILQSFVSRAELGVYEIAYVYAAALGVVTQGLHAAWVPNFFKTAASTEGREKYAWLADLFFVGIFSVAIASAYLANDLIGLVADSRYAEAPRLARILLIGMCFQATFFTFKNPVMYQARTTLMLQLSALGVSVNLICNALFVPRYGYDASAWATVLAYASMALVMSFASRRVLEIPWNDLTTIGLLVILIGSLLISGQFDGHTFISFAVRVVAILASVSALAFWVMIIHRLRARKPTTPSPCRLH